MDALYHLRRPVHVLVDELAGLIANQVRYPYVYTYPPKGAYRPSDDHEAVVASWRDSTELTIYAHVPFCDFKCSFCTLFTTIGQPTDRIDSYRRAMVRELDILIDPGATQRTVRSLYFGGGTPTVLTPEGIHDLIAAVRQRFVLAPGAEVSVESTPDAVDVAGLQRLADYGVNRISFGVQSFTERELLMMGRRYAPTLSYTAPRDALKVGIPNVNVDLIFGIPGQQYTDWVGHLGAAIELGVQTITLYPLVVRDRTKYARLHRVSPGDFMDESRRGDWYDRSVRMLAEHGYRQRSEVTFARPGGGCEHEANEFRGLPTLGLGAGARSYAPSLHYTNDAYPRVHTNVEVIDRYLRDIAAGRASVASAVGLDPGEQRLRYVILALLHDGVEGGTYQAMFGEGMHDQFGNWFTALTELGFAIADRERVALSAAGRAHSALIGRSMFSREVAAMSEGYR
jgi:oxygen-independent coproporphyrinogen III oxidase